MKSWPTHFKQLAILLGIVLLVGFMMSYNTRLGELNHLTQKAATVRVEATQVMQTQQALQTQIAAATSDTVTEREAREQGQIRDGDQRIVLVPADGPPIIEHGQAAPTPERITRWQVWLELFFGK
jgi:hypothetical protein